MFIYTCGRRALWKTLCSTWAGKDKEDIYKNRRRKRRRAMAKGKVADQQKQKGVGRSCLLSGNFLDRYPTVRNKHCTFAHIRALCVARSLLFPHSYSNTWLTLANDQLNRKQSEVGETGAGKIGNIRVRGRIVANEWDCVRVHRSIDRCLSTLRALTGAR